MCRHVLYNIYKRGGKDMINTNNNLPRTAQKQLKKVTQSTMLIDRHQRVEPKQQQQDTPEEPEEQQANKHKKGLLDIYV
ncbi:hypothetical protein [Photobacterium profundum]|uniref:hypothetical protein n=1 Tax=Photobacterium profundum TaxID=74109 RepID=UPI0003227946|nr:hypothetical protein [Photobacterium profundum]